ncbi:MAG: glutathione S-transferase family protein [Pseudomonadota bacterium]
MKLHGDPIAINVHRVMVFANEKGIDLPIEKVDVIKGENLEDAYLKINPRGTMPVLELDNGRYLEEAPAINQYLESRYPEPNLCGTDAESRAFITARERWVEFEGLSPAGDVLRNSVPFFEGRSLPGHAGRVDCQPVLIDRGKQRLELFYKLFEDRISQSKYVAGDAFSMADITACLVFGFATASPIGAGVPLPETHTHTKRWLDEVFARPSFAFLRETG